MPDKIDRLLAKQRKHDALTFAINTLTFARNDIQAARKAIGGPPSYAKNRMGCVTTEIAAALSGLRAARRLIRRSINRSKL